MNIKIKIPYIADEAQLARLCFIIIGSLFFSLEFGLIVAIGIFFMAIGIMPYSVKE